MDVYDSNIWIHGLVGGCEEAIALIDEVIHNPVHVGVSAYIFDEVMENLQRADLDQEVIDSAQTEFAAIVHENHTVHGPTQEELRQMDLGVRRRDDRVEMMAEVLGIQAKDVPILVYAHQLAQQPDTPESTIVTADREFSRFDPHQHFQNISIRFVDCSS
ncbi:hypothetical protein OB920_20380 [Halobacteria archaeon HArc-gm2]|nr:hypothetical protein [Halobacteria archaeon HArc-gm2]